MEMVFDTDLPTKTVQVFHYDDLTDKVTIEDRQDVSALLEHNKAVRDDEQFRPKLNNELRRVASIPLNMLYQMRATWSAMGLSWEERQAELRRFLNDPTMSAFRTDRSRV